MIFTYCYHWLISDLSGPLSNVNINLNDTFHMVLITQMVNDHQALAMLYILFSNKWQSPQNNKKLNMNFILIAVIFVSDNLALLLSVKWHMKYNYKRTFILSVIIFVPWYLPLFLPANGIPLRAYLENWLDPVLCPADMSDTWLRRLLSTTWYMWDHWIMGFWYNCIKDGSTFVNPISALLITRTIFSENKNLRNDTP